MINVKPEFFPCWSYSDALAWMKEAHNQVANNKNLIKIGYGSHASKIITLGRSYSEHDLDSYKKIPDTSIFLTDRGGGPTAHEPGQLVLYPVLNLPTHNLSVRDLVNLSEQAMLNFINSLGAKAELSNLSRGVFVGVYKIGFIGMRIRDNISYHGLAVNILNDAAIFKNFAPCGIKNLPVSSLCYHLNISESLAFYGEKLCEAFLENLRIVLRNTNINLFTK